MSHGTNVELALRDLSIEIEKLQEDRDKWRQLARDLMKWSDPPKMDWANDEYRVALTAYWKAVRGE